MSAAPAKALPSYDYIAAINRANALKKSGQFEDAIAIYVDALAREQARCSTSPPTGSLDQLPQSSPCWHEMKILFNLGITRRDQGRPTLAAKVFSSYLSRWRALFPHASSYPWEARALFEIAQANFTLKRWRSALDHYRHALTRWRALHSRHRPRFADVAHRRLAESLERLHRRTEAATAYEEFLSAYARVHGHPHADSVYLRKKIAALRLPKKPARLPSRPVPPNAHVSPNPPRSTTWLVLAISSTVLAVASEGVAIAFTLWANDTYRDLPEYGMRRGVAIAGHVTGGLAALGAGLAYYLYYRRGREKTATPRRRARLRLLVGPRRVALRWRF